MHNFLPMFDHEQLQSNVFITPAALAGGGPAEEPVIIVWHCTSNGAWSKSRALSISQE